MRTKGIKRLAAAMLAAVLAVSAGIPLLSELMKITEMKGYAIDEGEIRPGDRANLRFNLTWLNNSGKWREEHGASSGAYLRNKLRKEFFEGDPKDPKWGQFANSYCWCVANHVLWPEIGAVPVVRRISDLENRPRTADGREVDPFNFFYAALMLYYMSEPEHSGALYDKYTDTADYIIAKEGIGKSYEAGALTGDWAQDSVLLCSGPRFLYGGDFHPDSTGSSRIYEELNAPLKSPLGGEWTYTDQICFQVWKAAKVLSRQEWNWDGEGLYAVPRVEQAGDGSYHARVSFSDVSIDASFFAALEPDSLYGDWRFCGILPEEGGGLCLDLQSETGRMPEEGVLARLRLRPESGFENLNTDFSKARILQFYFPGQGGRDPGQDMLAASFEGELILSIREGGPAPSGEGEVQRYLHEETFEANYQVSLMKYDRETGKPLAGAQFDVLEAFDDSQLHETDLDHEEVPEYSSSLGSLLSTDWREGDSIERNYTGDRGVNQSPARLFNMANRKGSQFQRWEGWDAGGGEEVCTRDRDITGEDGRLYTGNTDGSPDLSRPAHRDVKEYRYQKGYCGGHPAPVVSYEPLPEYWSDPETGEDNQDEIDAVDQANQKLHERAWEEWLREVELCEGLVAEGGFFHAIDPELARESLEEDRDAFYRDFIALRYQYSVKELKARTGYILHGLHHDDVPPEIRTVTSSEWKDFQASGLRHQGGFWRRIGKEQGEEAIPERRSAAAKRPSEKHLETAEEGQAEEAAKKQIATVSRARRSASPSESEREIRPHRSGTGLTGFLKDMKEMGQKLRQKSALTVRKAEKGSGGASFSESQADRIRPLDPDSIDWTFVLYDHRTEGEVHFNKQDLDLIGQEGSGAYGEANGDGTLEGAVYGLFAKGDLLHPDGKTGIVYRQNDLVAVAATDRDGNGSFMVCTEAPGRTYSYERGETVQRQDISHEGPENLYGPEASDHGLQNNLELNGNYWIGRPLLLGEYYIRELSRSEGYELSVYGKEAEISNREAFLQGDGRMPEGRAEIREYEIDPAYRGNRFTLESTGLGEAGCDVFFSGMPEAFQPEVSILEKETWEEKQSYRRPVYGEKEIPAPAGERVILSGSPVEAQVGDEVELPCGEKAVVRDVSEGEDLYETVYPDNLFYKEPAAILIEEADTLEEFLQKADLELGKSYQRPSAGAPWRILPLDPEGSPLDWSRTLNEALSDMTAFNAMELSAVRTSGGVPGLILRYSYIQQGREAECLYDIQHKKVLLKKPVWFDGTAGFVYAAYGREDCRIFEEREGFVWKASMRMQEPSEEHFSGYEDLEKIRFRDLQGPSYWIYEEGDSLLDDRGLPVTEPCILDYETVTETVEKEREVLRPLDREGIRYVPEKGAWVLHLGPEEIPEDGSLRLCFESRAEKLSHGGLEYAPCDYADLFVSLSAAPGMILAGSYMETVSLLYEGQEQIRSDGNTGGEPVRVLERPIRQRVRIRKEILKEEGGNQYGMETPEQVPGFRFKAYLRSNLERLYRDREGGIQWLDRNGNELSYEELLELKAPWNEVPETKGPDRVNVRNLYTRVSHKEDSILTGKRDNNLRADYLDPESWEEQVALRIPHSTSLGPGGTGVLVNSALYSYRGRNADTNRSPAIREESNQGFTRILEMRERTGEAQEEGPEWEYNYDKFFDALDTANGDKWILQDQTSTSWRPLGNEAKKNDYGENNARASDRVRQFAITWYLEDEAAKLFQDNGYEENLMKKDPEGNRDSDQLYDEALNNALAKAFDYLKPFFSYDLDRIYSIPWDGIPEGGEDGDPYTLTADQEGTACYEGVSAYLPYGVYVIREQQPGSGGEGASELLLRNYGTDSAREVRVPSLYEEGAREGGEERFTSTYVYNPELTLEEQAASERFLIRFGEEGTGRGGLQKQVIRASGHDGSFEVYPYGLEPDRLRDPEGKGEFSYLGFSITQEAHDPLKDYYNPVHRIFGRPLRREEGANEESHYFADDGKTGRTAANGEVYLPDAIEARYHYASVSEQAGTAGGLLAMQGVLTAWEGAYGQMLVPWTVRDPKETGSDDAETGETSCSGYGEGSFRNRFYKAFLRIEKLDGETHENLLHDGALFLIYRGERDPLTGKSRFYEKDTVLKGSRLFLEAMCAEDIRPAKRRWGDKESLFQGTVRAGTPICSEEDQVVLSGSIGPEKGRFGALSTLRETLMKQEDTDQDPKEFRKQTVGYLLTPEPLGAGNYVLCEAPPPGYIRSKPVAVELYSDGISYYQEGDPERPVKGAVFEDTARIFVENDPIRLQVEKKKEDGKLSFRIGEQIWGSLTEIGGDPELEYAYSKGNYLGYAYRKGTLERLMALREAGEEVEIVFNGEAFAGYGYVSRARKTEQDENPYVAGALLTLYDAIELYPSGDREDQAFQGLKIRRSNTGNVEEMIVKKGAAGEKTEYVRERQESGEGDLWKAEIIERPDTEILFYSLDDLSLTFEERIGGERILFGWDRDHKKTAVGQLMADREKHEKTDREYSIYGFSGGRPLFEFTGGDLTKLSYDGRNKLLKGDFAGLRRKGKEWKLSEGTLVYHLDRDGNRDALTDPYTGMAYVLEPKLDEKGQHVGDRVLVWPVHTARDEAGNVIARDKIPTARPATLGEDSKGPGGTEYLNGTWTGEAQEKSHQTESLRKNSRGGNMTGEALTGKNNGSFQNRIAPVYDPFGLVRYYQRSGAIYEKGLPLYDRNHQFARFKTGDLLEAFNRGAYALDSHEALFDGKEDLEEQEQDRLYHRQGESYLLENTWKSSDRYPNDPFRQEELEGQADILKRLPKGSYILEELLTPEGKGYVKALPVGITVREEALGQVSMKDDTTKLYIEKRDGNSGRLLSGVHLALYPAKRIPDPAKPEGYCLEKTGEMPFHFEITDSHAGKEKSLRCEWLTEDRPIYLEGIPEGDYLLEELSAPEGYVRSEAVPVLIRGTGEIHSVEMKNRLTEIGIRKFTWEGKEKVSLPGARFTLYRAETDESGEPVFEEGEPLYDPEQAAASRTTGEELEYQGFSEAFEKMYQDYGKEGSEFRYSVKRRAVRSSKASNVWQLEDGRRIVTGGKPGVETVAFPASMIREDREGFKAAYGRMLGEKLSLEWKVERQVKLQVLRSGDASLAGGRESRFPVFCILEASLEESGKKVRIRAGYDGNEFHYDYRFGYERLPAIGEQASAWIRADGLWQLEGLPVGESYVLVEEQAPAGYAPADPILIRPEEREELQVYEVLNEGARLLICKTAAGEKKVLPGPELALYRADEEGKLREIPELLEDRWISGQDGSYTEKEQINGEIPEGFLTGDLRPHEITGLRKGTYYLTEQRSLPYYRAMEPLRIEYDGETRQLLVRAENEPAAGKLIIHKTDEAGAPLSGAVFELDARTASGEAVRGFPMLITDIGGRVRVSDLPLGEIQEDGSIAAYSYTLRELRPPAGYATDGRTYSFSFEDGEESYGKDPHILFALQEMEIRNQETCIYLEKKQLMDPEEEGDGDFLEGALLSVYPVEREEDGSYVYREEEPFDQWISSKKEGGHALRGLVAGQTYVFLETEAPEGYSLMKPVLFTVTPDGRGITGISSQMTLVKAELMEEGLLSLTVTGRYAMGTEIRVLDPEGREVLRFAGTGGTHQLTEEEGLQEGQLYSFLEYTRYSDGTLGLSRKETGRVRFRDGVFLYQSRHAEGIRLSLERGQGLSLQSWIQDPQLAEKVITLKPDPEDPKLILRETTLYTGGEEQESGRFSFTVGEGNTVDAIGAYDRQGEVMLRKTDLFGEEPLEGARLQLLEEDRVLREWISGKEAESIRGLEPGRTYRLREVEAPEGYVKAEDILFRLNEEGIPEEIRMEDDTTKLSVLKVDAQGKQPIGGAVFEIRDQNGTVRESWTSEQTAHLVEGKLRAGEEYILHEVKAPKGYRTMEDMAFRVPDGGELLEILAENTKKRNPPGGGGSGRPGKTPEPEQKPEPEDVPVPEIPPEEWIPEGVPKTGDFFPEEGLWTVFFLSVAGSIFLMGKGKEKGRKVKGKRRRKPGGARLLCLLILSLLLTAFVPLEGDPEEPWETESLERKPLLEKSLTVAREHPIPALSAGAFLLLVFPALALRAGLIGRRGFLLWLCLLSAGGSGILLYAHDRELQRGEAVYAVLRQTVCNGESMAGKKEPDAEQPEVPQVPETTVAEPESLSQEAGEPMLPAPDERMLRGINPEYRAWIFIPDTAVNYPVLLPKSNEAYLDQTFDGRSNSCGALFFDLRVVPGLDGPGVIHGHNMRSGAMFGGLKSYLSRNYLQEHADIYLLRDGQWEKYRVLSAGILSEAALLKRLESEDKPERLLLCTCYGRSDRLVLEAEEVNTISS